MDSCGNQVSELARCLLLAMGTIKGTHTHTHTIICSLHRYSSVRMEIATPGSLLLVWGLYIEAGCLLLVLDSFSLIVFFAISTISKECSHM